MRSYLGSFHRHGVDAVYCIHSDIHFFWRISRNDFVTEFESIHAHLEIGVNVERKVKVLCYLVPSVLVVEKIEAFANNNSVLSSNKFMSVFLSPMA
jgi:hypothetical protein